MTQPWAPDNVSAESPHVRCPSEEGKGTVSAHRPGCQRAPPLLRQHPAMPEGQA